LEAQSGIALDARNGAQFVGHCVLADRKDEATHRATMDEISVTLNVGHCNWVKLHRILESQI
jgi:hypothetical protein